MTQLAAFDRHLPQDVATESRAPSENPEGESGRAPDLPMSGEGMNTRTARPTKKGRSMARRQGIFDDLMSIGLKLPWKVGVAAAAVIFVALHIVAVYTRAPVSTNTLGGLGAVVRQGFVHVFAEFLQYIIPTGLLIGSTVGYFKQRSRNAAAESGVATTAEARRMCPQCGTDMIQRTAKKGQSAGQRFWGCGRYPKCTGTLKIS